MALTDLTNTKWLFNNEPSLADDEWHINFTSNNQTFDTINPTDASEIMWYSYNNYSVMIDAYNENSTPRWQNEAYKTIEITGGTDVTNANLISWLESNATQIASTVGIKLGNNTLLGVDTIALTDATDNSNTVNFSYGVTPSGTVSVKLGDNTLTNVNTLSVLGSDLTYKSFGYAAQLGGTISLRGAGHSDPSADSYYSYIKINEAPTTAQDYDYMVTGKGYVNSKTQMQITQPVVIEGVNVAYLWCDYNANFTCKYKVDNGSYQNLTPFSSPTTLTLTNDIELTLTGWTD